MNKCLFSCVRISWAMQCNPRSLSHTHVAVLSSASPELMLLLLLLLPDVVYEQGYVCHCVCVLCA